MFQSSPSLGAGSNLSVEVGEVARVEFQSSPSLGAGSNAIRPSASAASSAFQSSPSLGAGSNKESAPHTLQEQVSILSQLRCWEQRGELGGDI